MNRTEPCGGSDPGLIPGKGILLNLEGNADNVEEILSMNLIEDLIHKGYLYQPRFDTYKELS